MFRSFRVFRTLKNVFFTECSIYDHVQYRNLKRTQLIAIFKWVRPHPAGRAFKKVRFHLKAQPARFSPQDARRTDLKTAIITRHLPQRHRTRAPIQTTNSPPIARTFHPRAELSFCLRW